MTEADVKAYWYYFRSLANQLCQTEQYVDHSFDKNGIMINGVTFSNEFAKILMLASAEFEVIAKELCTESGITIRRNANIMAISREILTRYPHIGETIISTPYVKMQPLKDWRMTINGRGQDEVAGIEWWGDHNDLKHNRGASLVKANLKNCIYATASLLVLEIYLSMAVLGNIDEISTSRCAYFDFHYGLCPLTTNPNWLPPDFM